MCNRQLVAFFDDQLSVTIVPKGIGAPANPVGAGSDVSVADTELPALAFVTEPTVNDTGPDMGT
jgi:hypothetical protein